MILEIAGLALAVVLALAGLARWVLVEARTTALHEVRVTSQRVEQTEAEIAELRVIQRDDRSEIRADIKHIKELLEDIFDKLNSK